MADLYNEFPSWGESGEYPQSGFFYEGGDQVNEKHLDALWNGVEKHVGNLNTAIRDRIRDLEGNTVIDTGLVASQGSSTREVDVSSSDGAYVDGQFTGSISAATTSHSANGGTSTRTDVVWVNTNGNVSKSEGQTTTAQDQLKIAEVDISTDDTISDIRNYARDVAFHFSSENKPSSARRGDLWEDITTDRLKVRQSGAFRNILTDEDSITINSGDGIKNGGSINLWNGSITLNIEPADFAGSGLQDDGADNLELVNDSTTINSGDGLSGGGTVPLGGSTTLDVSVSDFAGSGLSDDGSNNLQLNSTQTFSDLTVDTIEATGQFENATYATLSDVPTNLPEGTQVYVEDEDTLYIEDGT